MVSWPKKVLFRAVAVLLGAFAMLAAIELAGRAFLALRPSYEVLFLEPDRAVGWKLVPENRFTWTGMHWYAADFSVDVETNSAGFRDLERSIDKPDGVVRVALLGDSFIEALQVPFDQTAAQLLEKTLDREGARAGSGSGSGERYEVLNFGVSNYGLGQTLLVWEAYVKRYRPDYVFVFVAEYLMRRTTQRYEEGAFPASRARRLWVRPTFRLENGELVLEPAEDFDAFVLAQESLLQTRFRNGRSRVREQSLLGHLLKTLAVPNAAQAAKPPRPRRPARALAPSGLDELNAAVLRALGRSVERAGGKLVIVDATGFFLGKNPVLHDDLTKLCETDGFGYVPAYRALEEARARGRALRWAHDGHLDQEGNEILAQEMARWISEASRPMAGADASPPR